MSRQAVRSLAAGQPSNAEAFLDHERYEVGPIIGRGGMAVVYEAVERSSRRKVALKLMNVASEPERQRRHLELFEREFHTLSQLAHPRIVQVYDFGSDAAGTYYTMELLAGGDLQELAPLPWRRACAIARDICSALAFLHARRFIHRDVSPRNIRSTADGPAKLIDFGALSTMGPTKLLVGTPPCCAPETLHMQTVDGRTDLFSLGASLYFMLVGEHAYPARSFALLDTVWHAGFERPSQRVADIPAELDTLVMDLLRLVPDARPASAAEVMERLSAIDGEGSRDPETAAQAYLAEPTLVGRSTALTRVRRRLERRTGGRSRSVVIESAPGMGRTRFLDACLLDATLAGQLVVRVDSDDAISGEYGAVRALASQLLIFVPQIARETAAPWLTRLIGLVPELASDGMHATELTLPRSLLQRALHDWLLALSKRRPLVIAIDDFHLIDEPSAALLSLLALESSEHELCVLLTLDPVAQWKAESVRKLLSPLTTLSLEPLSAADSEVLLRSVFGSVPHIEALSEQISQLCAGCPRDLLRIAQHLIDRGVARYAAGTWTLPAKVDVGDLPESLADALSLHIERLPEPARELACALALCFDRGFSFDDCAQLSATRDPAQRVAHLDALMSADIVRKVGDDITLSQRTWVPLLLANVSHERALLVERRLAELFEQQPEQQFRAAKHWFRSGESSRALDLLIAHVTQTQAGLVRGPDAFSRYLLSLPDGWFDTFQEGIALCETLARPRKHRFLLLRRVLVIVALLDTRPTDLWSEAFRYLRRDSGHDDWAALADMTDADKRLMVALGRARTRYDALPEHERVLDPLEAIRDLAQAVVAAMGPVANQLDVVTLRALPDLAAFTGLSPALYAVHQLVGGVGARITGRVRQARRIYAEVLQRVQRADRAGLDESYATYLELSVMSALGMIEAGLGLSSCLGWAERIATHPAMEVNATVIRMLDRYFQGDVASAEMYKRQAERSRIQNTGRQLHEGGHLIWEVQAHAMSGDLTRVRQASDAIAVLAKRYPQWLPVQRFATAEYHRMTRDFERARIESEKALDATTPGSHQIWVHAAAAHVLSLLELGQRAQAVTRAVEYGALSEKTLDYIPDPLQLALGLARAHSGDAEAAPPIDALIARLNDQGITGLRLTVAYETRARIALVLQDMTAFAHFAELCRQSCFAYKNPALTAKHHRLLHEARRLIVGDAARAGRAADSVALSVVARIEQALAKCRDDDQRARLSLTLLTQQSGAKAGVLYLLGDRGPVCAARVGAVPEQPALAGRVQAYLTAQLEESADITATQTGEATVGAGHTAIYDDEGRIWRPILLSHVETGGLAITGVAMLVPAATADFTHPGPIAAAIGSYYASKGATSLMLASD